MTTAISEVNALAPVPFAADLRRFGDATAMIDDDRVVSYDELADRVDELAQELGEGRRLVLLRAANRVDAVCAYLACLAPAPQSHRAADVYLSWLYGDTQPIDAHWREVAADLVTPIPLPKQGQS